MRKHHTLPKRLRLKRRMTVAQVAAAAYVSASLVYYCEATGRWPKRDYNRAHLLRILKP